jgi:thiamine-phosphate pyrophosphorylase
MMPYPTIACYNRAMKNTLASFFDHTIYGIISVEHGAGRLAEELCTAMLAGGIKIIQYREKYRSQKIRYKECVCLRRLTRAAGAIFIVNDDIAVAQAVDADGIHIGQDDMPIEEARKIVGEEKIIGLSTHSPAQGLDAVARGADYIGVGPVFTTQTKANVCAAVGLEYVRFVKENITIPWVAIGGIKEHNIVQVTSAGASCVCLVTEITAASDVTTTAKQLCERMLR